METFIKEIKLTDDNRAIVKTIWTSKDITYEIFVQKESDDWAVYRAKADRISFESQCKKLKVSPDVVKECLASKKNMKEIYYELDRRDSKKLKFLVLLREESESVDAIDESYIEHTYACLSVEEVSISAKMITDALLEVKAISERCQNQQELIEKLQGDIRDIKHSFEDLIKRHTVSEKQLYSKFRLLLNSKKCAVNNSTILCTSSESEKDKATSSVAKPQLEISVRKHTTPTKKLAPQTSSTHVSRKTSSKRTPSKILQNQILSLTTSDSDSEVPGIIKKDGETKKSVFNTRKITPVKPKEPERKRDSSIELKINRPSAIKSVSPMISSTSESESKSRKALFSLQNAQQIELDDDFLGISQSSSEIDADKNTTGSRKREAMLSSMSDAKKLRLESSDNDEDPYEANTLDVLKHL